MEGAGATRGGVWMRKLGFVFGLLVAGAVAFLANALPSLTSVWNTSFGPSPQGTCVLNIEQGPSNSLSLIGSCQLAGSVSLSGNFDPNTGAFTAEGSLASYCPVLLISGTFSTDGNTLSGDFNCSNIFFGTFTGSRVSGCQNGIIEAGEECDDGNNYSCDGCSATCQIELGLLCGDGVRNAACGEECDDGNTNPGDGCTNDCTICGNGVLKPPEECDDGNITAGDGCNASCQCDGTCGDGQLVSQFQCGEKCDDGNITAGDGCSASCQCEGTCGDGQLNPTPGCGEKCDDGNNTYGDGCSAICQVEANKDEQNCINELNEGFAKVAKVQGRENARCVKAAGRGRVASAEACLTADSRGQVAKAKSRNEKGQTRSCTGVTPPFGATDAATGNQVAVSEELDLIHDIFGLDLDAAINASVDRAGAKCQVEVAKLASRCQDAKLQWFNECKKNVLNGEFASSDATGLEACMGTVQRVARKKPQPPPGCAGSRGFRRLQKKCATTDIAGAFPGECSGEASPFGLAVCLDGLIGWRVCLALNEVDGLNIDCEP